MNKHTQPRQRHSRAYVSADLKTPVWAVVDCAIQRQTEQRLWALANDADDLDAYLVREITRKQETLKPYYN